MRWFPVAIITNGIFFDTHDTWRNGTDNPCVVSLHEIEGKNRFVYLMQALDADCNNDMTDSYFYDLI